jgi:hypothetical protein
VISENQGLWYIGDMLEAQSPSEDVASVESS